MGVARPTDRESAAPLACRPRPKSLSHRRGAPIAEQISVPKHPKFTRRTAQRVEQLPCQIQNHVTRRNLVVYLKMFLESFRQDLPHSRCSLSRPHHSQERLRLINLGISWHRLNAKCTGRPTTGTVNAAPGCVAPASGMVTQHKAAGSPMPAQLAYRTSMEHMASWTNRRGGSPQGRLA